MVNLHYPTQLMQVQYVDGDEQCNVMLGCKKPALC
jgi:hypothetical protein